jgi:hypothetical protein
MKMRPDYLTNIVAENRKKNLPPKDSMRMIVALRRPDRQCQARRMSRPSSGFPTPHTARETQYATITYVPFPAGSVILPAHEVAPSWPPRRCGHQIEDSAMATNTLTPIRVLRDCIQKCLAVNRHGMSTSYRRLILALAQF